jgi:LytTr DNA-binding domain
VVELRDKRWLVGTNAVAKNWFEGFDQHKVLYSYLLFALYLLINNSINASSVWMEHQRDPLSTLQWWEPVLWEYSSAVSTLLLTPFLVWFFHKVPPRFHAIGLQLSLHFVASLVFCIGHISLMVALRKLVYGLLSRGYDFGPVVREFFYEYRKDVWGYLFLFALFHLAQFVYRRLKGDAMLIGAEQTEDTADTKASLQNNSTPEHFLVRKLDKEFLVKVQDIDWLESSGNYVNLHSKGRIYPLRATLANTVELLQHKGFSRIHRSLAVNHHAIHSISYDPSGDGEIVLNSGEKLSLSRRFKDEFRARFQGKLS